MAVKTKYRLGGRFTTALSHNQLCPLALYETAPGESWSGELKIRGVSAATKDLLLNRCFFDAYLFYIPYRSVWDQWPNFITQSSTAVDQESTVPTYPPFIDVGGFQVGGYEKLFVKQPMHSTSGGHNINALPVRAYNAIFNHYFREEGDALVSEDTAPCQTVPLGTRDYHARLVSMKPVTETAIPGGTLDDLREALAEEHFARMRAMYGDKYGDYLKALGVNPASRLAEAPELLGRTSTEMSYRVTANTSAADSDLGETGGYYTLRANLGIRRKFFPEHGVLMAVGVSKMDTQISSASHPIYAKYKPRQYWSPEFDAMQVDDVELTNIRTIQQNGAAAYPTNFAIPPEKYLDYKTGFVLDSNAIHSTVGGAVEDFLFTRPAIPSTDNEAAVKSAVLKPPVADYANSLATATDFISVQTACRFEKASPISRWASDPLK